MHPQGARPLDDPKTPGSFDASADPPDVDTPVNPAPEPVPPAPEPVPPGPDPSPPGRTPGVGEQLKSTRDAAKGLFTAHVDLAKTEMAVIGGQIARAAGLLGCAFALLLLVGLLLLLGGSMFLAEWLLGSIGWAVLHGTILFVAFAFALVLAAIGYGPGRIAGWFVLALLLGIGISVVLGLGLLNQAYASVGDALIPGVDPAYRTILAGALTGAVVLAIVALVPAFLVGGGGAVAVVLLGLVAGAALGAFTAITFGWQPAFGVGLAVGYVLWFAFLVADLFRTGIDDEAIKARFYPGQTIDTTKETLEWLKRRMPRGNES